MKMINFNVHWASQRRRHTYRPVVIYCRYVSLAIALVLSTLVYAQTAKALELRCANANVVVQSADLADAKLVCEGAADAIRFLRDHRFMTNVRVEIVVVDTLPDIIGPSAYGGYILAEGRAYLLNSSEIADRGSIFGLPVEEPLYRSLATHEVAHAIATLNFQASFPPVEAQEYIAYVVMFANMPAEYRDQLLERVAGQRFDDERQINDFVYLVEPLRFGILVYKHFMKLENKTDFLQQVLSGRQLAGENPPY